MQQIDLPSGTRRPLGAAREARGETPGLGRAPAARLGARGPQQPASARTVRPDRSATGARLGGRLGRLRLSLAGLGVAGVHGSWKSDAAGGPRLARALRARLRRQGGSERCVPSPHPFEHPFIPCTREPSRRPAPVTRMPAQYRSTYDAD